MKYMIMMTGGLGASLANRKPAWITEMHQLMMTITASCASPANWCRVSS